MNDITQEGPLALRLVRPAAWLFLVVFVFEIVFMISPFALTYYSAFGPTMSRLNSSSATAWLTKFNLPHFAHTGHPLLDALPTIGPVLLFAGLALFLVSAIPIYYSKLRKRGAVTGGVYAVIRHPQYVSLVIAGFGAVLVWPRTIAWLTLVSMLFAYYFLARWEEQLCLARFGDSYHAYMQRTGRFLPRPIERALCGWIPQVSKPAGRAATAVALVVALGGTAWLSGVLRHWSLDKTANVSDKNVAILSPALLAPEQLRGIYDLAGTDAGVRETLQQNESANYIIHVVPHVWRIPDLPLDAGSTHESGHYQPRDFDGRRFRVLISRAQTHGGPATGLKIVEDAYGIETRLLLIVDLDQHRVVEVAEAPRYVRWGEIYPPLF
jgi:protein-S-isoprenylcysteine O-methyltransferase Ste14